eukprot:gene2538-3288_t
MNFIDTYLRVGMSKQLEGCALKQVVILALAVLSVAQGQHPGQTSNSNITDEQPLNELSSEFAVPVLSDHTPLHSSKRYKKDSIAGQIEKALEKEFPENSKDADGAGRSFNDTMEKDEGVLETVARVTHEKKPKTGNNSSSTMPQNLRDGAEALFATLEDTSKNIDKALGVHQKESEPEDVARLIDAEDNEFVISNPKKGAMELQQDLRFISDLVVMIVFAAVGGVIFACLGQPVITGYLLAGSVCGPGGFGMIQELVQVETLAQLGVVFLLFALGVEFSAQKLRHVRGVAILGGSLQIVLLMFVCGTLAKIGGGRVQEGVFVGAFLSMSSTAVVLKCLQERNWLQSLQGQVTIGTLILQDCVVGLLFALLPVLGGESIGVMEVTVAVVKSFSKLAVFLFCCYSATRSLVPQFLRHLTVVSNQTDELYQLALIAFCLSISWLSDYLGLSIELGAFVAGVMVSTTEYADRTLHQIEPIRNIFAALFLASIGLIMNPSFLWHHMDILLASLLVVVTAKVTLIMLVVRAFGYTTRIAFTVAVSMAQVGEFAFVLLSRASNLGLVQRKLYLLLLGTTALSIVSTPLLFRLIPHLLRLATVMKWVPRDSLQDESSE